MERCEALIIGGGPGGAACAWALRRLGVDALVLDRRRFPRDKVCAGWITPQVAAELELELDDYAEGRVLQPLRGFRVSLLGERDVEVDYGRVVSYGIRRCEFDEYLLRRAGSRLRLGEALHSIEGSAGGWTVNDEIRAHVLVGAGGHFCPLARAVSPDAPEPVVAAQEMEFLLDDEAECPVRPEIPELFFTRDLCGYGWVFRKGAYLNVGLGRQDRRNLSDHLASFLEHLGARGRLPRRLPRAKGHAYLLYGQTARPLAGEGFLLVGDAAGLAYTRSGEGIRPAVESGLLAARAIFDAKGSYDAASLAPYAEAIESRFGPRSPGRRLEPTRWLPRRWRTPIAARMLASRWFAGRFVVSRWFLHMNEPALSPRDIALDRA